MSLRQKSIGVISIHLMLMLITLAVISLLILTDFNTSHVNVNHGLVTSFLHKY